jgi:hypothetical protein
MPAICTICAAHAPDAFSVKPAATSTSSPVSSLRSRAPDAGAVVGGPAGERPDGLPRVDRRIGNRERALDPRVQPGLHLQRLADRDLLRRQRTRPAPLHELVAVRGIVVGRDDEQPAGVLDAVGDDAAQDRVLGHALLGGDAVLDDVAPAGMQQAVKAAARALGEIGAVDEDDVEPAQRRVPRDSGARRAAADDQYVGLEARHTASLHGAQRPTNVLRVKSRQTTQRSPCALVGLPRSLAPHSAVPGCIGFSA